MNETHDSGDGTPATKECPTCGEPVASDDLLCGSCFVEGQSHGPHVGLKRQVRTNGLVEDRPVPAPSAACHAVRRRRIERSRI